MPIFNDITFIHIPKCGGSSITKFLMDKNYRYYYNDSDIEKVYNIFKRDIEYFGYEF